MGKRNRIRQGALLPLPNKPNCVSTQTDQKKKRMRPLPFKGTLTATHQRLEEILHLMDRTTIKTSESDYLHAVVKSKVLRFKDDVEFLLDEQSRLVHFRSASRTGYSDLGVNQKRMEEISQLYLEEN